VSFVTVFQRARNEEQREARRQTILGAAAAMLAEMPVAEVTLNELSRRAGLAKSNVLRYFESREAVLLELLDSAWRDWLVQLDRDLQAAIDAAAPTAGRSGQLAAVLAASLASRPMLCDLISAQAAVLERNVSPQVAAQYKRASIAAITALGILVLGCVPELGEQDAVRLAGVTVMMTGALWPHTQPSAAMLAAYGRVCREHRGRAGPGRHAPGLQGHPRRGAPGDDRWPAGAFVLLALPGGHPGAGSLHALGQPVDAERGPVGIWQPVNGQAASDVIDRGADPGDLRVVSAAVGHEELIKPWADEVGKGNLMLQAQGEGDGVHVHQASAAAAVLAPVDEHLAETSVVTLVGSDPEPLGVDGDRGGVSAATS
jgi:AcrR family transcriptional regulator